MYKSIRLRRAIKNDVLRNFQKLIEKRLCLSLSRSATLLKRDSNTGAFREF